MVRLYYSLGTFACALGLVVLGFAGSAAAQTNWSGAISSDWSNSDNWDAGVPTSTVDANIIGGTNDPSLDADGSAQNLTLGGMSGMVGAAGHLTVPDHTLTVTDDIYLGWPTGTTSTITQSGGTVTAFYLWAGSTVITEGVPQTGSGDYTMTGGTFNVEYFELGNMGTSTFTQSGGTVNNTVGLYIGDNWVGYNNSIPANPGGATYILEGDGVFNGPSATHIQYVGIWGGTGTLTIQDYGELNNYSMSVGGPFSPMGATGHINLHDSGQLNLNGTLTLSGNALSNGTLTQDGGTLTCHTLNGGSGTFTHNFTGGTLNVSEVLNMDLANGGGTVNVGGVGALATIEASMNNIALGKTATHSSTWTGLGPELAVNGSFTDVAHTGDEDIGGNAWWKVDLTGGGTTSVHDIILTARYNGWAFQLSNFYVRVLDDDDSTVLWEDLFITEESEILDPGENFWVSLPSAVDGRYVQVQLNGFNLGPEYAKHYLAITECQVGAVLHGYGYSQVATGTLGIELDPTNELCDKLIVGTLELAGTLEVTSLGGDFSSGQVFDILDWDTLVGTFDTVNLPTLTGSLSWDDSSLYVTGELEVVGGPAVPGDANGDGYVDELDAQRLAENWGATVPVGGMTWWEMGDFDGDEFVGPADAAIMAANWGYGPTEGTSVPEPGVIAMLVMGAAGLLAFAGRKRH